MGRGIFAVLLLLLASVSIMGLASAFQILEKKTVEGIATAVEAKRLFYAARDIESSFWKSVRTGISNCAKADDVETCVKTGYLQDWKRYAESYWLDAKFLAYAGSLSGGWVAKSQAAWDSPLTIIKIPVNQNGVHAIRATITTSTGYDGIFVEIDGRDARTYALMKSGESYSCLHVPVAGDALELGVEYSGLPAC